MIYKCKHCGKEFSDRYKLTGHSTWCEKNLKFSREERLKQLDDARSHISNVNAHKRGYTIKKDTTEFTCQYCGKICIGKNSLINHERLCKNNPNRQISNFVKYNKKVKQAWNKGLTKETDERVRKGAKNLKEAYSSGKVISHNKGITLSEEEKLRISKSRKRYLKEHPDKVPYLLNHSSKISYPEQYFINVFQNENIPLNYHKQFGLYELDFYNEEFKVYVEIDGEQHYLPQSIERDKIRDEYFKQLGWRGIRIRWAHFIKSSDEEKQNIIKNIKILLNHPS